MALFVRRLKVQDLPTLEDIEAAHQVRRPGWLESFRKLVEVTLRDEPEGLMIAEQDGEVVGWAAIRQRGHDPMSGLRYGHILHLSVSARHGKAGVTQRLLKEAEAYLRSRGCEAIYISTPADDTQAVEGFKRSGYNLASYELHRTFK